MAKAKPKMGVEQIAQVAHELNKAFCESIGDTSQQPWADAPDWQKESAINGVKFHMAHPDADPEASHANWLSEKKADGWRYGSEKNEELKTHPCMVAYSDLPTEMKSKDFIFRQAVHSLLPYLVK